MKRIQGALAAAALVLGFGVAAAVPASASTEVTAAAADPAVVSCSFGELYNDQALTDFERYVPRNTELTVSGGSNAAWQVTVNSSGLTGWMSGDCVRFLA